MDEITRRFERIVDNVVLWHAWVLVQILERSERRELTDEEKGHVLNLVEGIINDPLNILPGKRT